VNTLGIELSFLYEYITDPPIMADIGATYFMINDLYLYMDMSPTIVDDHLFIDIHKLNFSLPEFAIDFDGISDLSIVVTEFA
jgi:hypothetical protein